MSNSADKLFDEMQVAYEQFKQRVALWPNRLTIHIDALELLRDKMYEFSTVTGATWVKRFNGYSHVTIITHPLPAGGPAYFFSYDYSIVH